MTRAAWLEHLRESVGDCDDQTSVEYHESGNIMRDEALKHLDTGCETCKARRQTIKASRNAKARYQAMKTLGLVKTPYGWE